MPALTSKYDNISIEAKRADSLKRTFAVSKFTSRTFATWAIESLESSLARSLYLKKAFPHFQILENYNNRFIIENTKLNKIVKVEWKENKAVCNEKDGADDYIIFA